MAFENQDAEQNAEEAGPPPEESSNRPFIIVAAILGAILLLALLCVAAYALIRLPAMRAGRATDQAKAIAQSTQMAISVQQTALAQAWTATPTRAPNTNTPLPPTKTPTPVLAVQNTETPTTDPRTATVAALLTQAAANAKLTVTPTVNATALPKSGFADEVGAPGLLTMGVVLIAVIFLARRLRTAS